MKDLNELDKAAENLQKEEKKSYNTNHAAAILGGNKVATVDNPTGETEEDKAIRLAEEKKGLQKKSYGFSIQNNLMAEFNEIVKANRLNKSMIVEDFIREFVEGNRMK